MFIYLSSNICSVRIYNLFRPYRLSVSSVYITCPVRIYNLSRPYLQPVSSVYIASFVRIYNTFHIRDSKITTLSDTLQVFAAFFCRVLWASPRSLSFFFPLLSPLFAAYSIGILLGYYWVIIGLLLGDYWVSKQTSPKPHRTHTVCNTLF